MFPGSVVFSGSRFGGGPFFFDAVFNGQVGFDDCSFESNPFFSECVFHEYVSFEDSIFSNGISISESKFFSSVSFSGARFENTAAMTHVEFVGLSYFGSAVFSGDAQFDNSVFHDVSFSQTMFCDIPSFKSSRFCDEVYFTDTKFHSTAFFDKATFHEKVYFSQQNFSVRFVETVFEGETSFHQVTFRKSLFHMARFNGPATFTQSTFEGPAAFQSSRFQGYASFVNVRFADRALFSGIFAQSVFSMSYSKFSHVPDFEQASFAEAPRIDNIHISAQIGIPASVTKEIISSIRSWRSPRVGSLWNTLSEEKGRQLASWRTLRRLAIQGHDHEWAILSFGKEMICRRWVVDRPWHLVFWLIAFYQLFSGFGASVIRPIVAWLVFSILFGGIYYYLGRYSIGIGNIERSCIGESVYEAWQSAAMLTLHRSSIGLSELGEKVPEMYSSIYGLAKNCLHIVPDHLLMIGMIQELFSSVLLFLLALALRNRFRLK